jgi:hypothetical protein
LTDRPRRAPMYWKTTEPNAVQPAFLSIIGTGRQASESGPAAARAEGGGVHAQAVAGAAEGVIWGLDHHWLRPAARPHDEEDERHVLAGVRGGDRFCGTTLQCRRRAHCWRDPFTPAGHASREVQARRIAPLSPRLFAFASRSSTNETPQEPNGSPDGTSCPHHDHCAGARFSGSDSQAAPPRCTSS